MNPSVMLNQLLSRSEEKMSGGLYTAIPAVVVSVVDGFSSLMVNVQPKLLVKNKDNSTDTRSVILNVPVQMPATKRSAITYPVAAGNDVLLIFSMEGIDSWKRHSQKTPVEPMDFRKHDMKDCYAITGVFPMANSVNSQSNRSLPHNTNDLVVSHNLNGNETEVRFLDGGGIIINTQQDVEVNCTNLTANTTNTEVNATSATVNADSVEVNSVTFDVNTTAASINAASLTLGAGSISAGGGGGGSTSGSWQGSLVIDGSLVVNGIDFDTHIHGGGTVDGKTLAPIP